MGIAGLLPFLKNATRQTNIKEFKGCTVAIDSYCWLHKGAFSCADKLALGEKTEQYVYYCLKYVNTLISYDIKPVMVFDGCRLPSKKEVEKQRKEKREHYKKKAAQLLREGKRSEARDALKLCIDITSEMALNLMDACRNKGVDCIVAPYEADAQLAYLNKVGIAQVVITEDSDLVLFGCEKNSFVCSFRNTYTLYIEKNSSPRKSFIRESDDKPSHLTRTNAYLATPDLYQIMYKMDFNGNGLLVERDALNKTVDLRADLYSFDKFRYMCILSGCDYLASVKGIGLKKAMMIFQRTRQNDMATIIKKIPTTLNLNVTVTPAYIDGFFRADNTFLYQLVYDPMKRKQVPLNPYPEGVQKEDVQYAGPYMDKELGYQLALGNLSVYDMKQIADFDPDAFMPKSNKWLRDSRLCMLSIWNKSYRPMSRIAENQLANRDENLQRKSTKGQEVTVNLNLPGVTKKKSPLKRMREPEEDSSVLTEKQLTALYGCSNPNTTSDESPAKRRRSDLTFSEHELSKSSDHQVLQDLSDLMGDPEGTGDVVKAEQDLLEKENLTFCANTSLEDSEKKKKRLNVFKASSNKKEMFKLNAAKTEVVSRFFTTSEQKFTKSTFFNKLDDSFENKKSTENDETEDQLLPQNIKNEEKAEENCNEEEFHSTENHSPKETTAEQPYGSFGFKSKLSSFKSDFSVKQCSTSMSTSDNVCKQFKPVINKPAVTKPALSLNSLNTESTVTNESQNMWKTSNNNINTNSSEQSLKLLNRNASQCSSTYSSQSVRNCSLSQGGDLYSIDGDSFGMSQIKSESQISCTDDSELPDLFAKSDDKLIKLSEGTSLVKCEGTPKSGGLLRKLSAQQKPLFYLGENSGRIQTGGVEAENVCDLKEDSNLSQSSQNSKVGCKSMGLSKSATSTPVTGSLKKTLPGCRSSGLTKKPKSKTNLKNNENSQASIKNFFSSFSFDKGKKDKLESARSPLSPKKNNI